MGVPKATGCLQGVKFMKSLGKFILNKTTLFQGSLAFPIFSLKATFLFALMKTVGNVRDMNAFYGLLLISSHL